MIEFNNSNKSSCWQMFFEIGVIKNFAIFTGKHLESLCNEVAELKACNFIKKRLQHKCFLVNIAKFLITAFLNNTSGGCFYMKDEQSAYK